MKCLQYILLTIALFCGKIVEGKPGPGYDCAYCQPEQIHIAFGTKSNDIVVTWSTFNDTQESRVQYGVGDMDLEAVGTRTLFVDGGMLKRSQWIHRVLLPNLKFNTRYVYHAGSDYGWSELFSFKTPPQGEDWVVRAAIYGDMGNKNAHSLSYLQDEAERDHFDVILHVGDFAYDMDTDDALFGDEFMRQIQPLAAAVPYMTCPGNHEEKYNFSNYRNRFSMPHHAQYDSMFYSFDLGPVHFVSISTEFYYFLQYGVKMLANQFEWLRRDLAEANRPENRRRRPWLALMGHRPMYCGNVGDDCWDHFLPNRVGLPLYGCGDPTLPCDPRITDGQVVGTPAHCRRRRPWLALLGHRPMYCSTLRDACWDPALPNRVGLPLYGCGLEPLLKEFGVDLVIWAHEHSYERTWPLYDLKVYNGSLEHPYVNPRAPVHIITGSAGCQEDTDKFKPQPPAWSAFRSSDYGYTRLAAHNRTHLHVEQVDVDLKGRVIDSVWIVKDRHEPYSDL